MITINIACYLVTDNHLEASAIPEKMMMTLIKSIRENGLETVHFPNRSIEVTGIFIPPKDCKYSLMILPNMLDE